MNKRIVGIVAIIAVVVIIVLVGLNKSSLKSNSDLEVLNRSIQQEQTEAAMDQQAEEALHADSLMQADSVAL